jgi:hypothetical protein
MTSVVRLISFEIGRVNANLTAVFSVEQIYIRISYQVG